MKNVLNMSMLVIFLLAGGYAKASGNLDVRVTDNQNLLVELGKVEEGTVLLLQDKNGEILFKDSILAKNSYRKILNLEVIPMGTYFFSLEKENRIQFTVLVKDSAGLKIKEDVSGVVFKPCYKMENDMVNFFLTNPKGERIEITVYDETGIEVGSTTSSNTVVEKTFDFSKVPAGNYMLQVNTKDRNFSKRLAVK